MLSSCLELTRAISGTRTSEEIYCAALDALERGLGVDRSSILLFDPDGVMRFKAYRRLSEAYRAAVEGHTPWKPDSPDPQPLVVPDVRLDPSLAPFLPVLEAEGIAAMAFIPLVTRGAVVGKFMIYFDHPRTPSGDDLHLAGMLAAQVAFAVERAHAEERARRDEERLRFALDAAHMGTWDWDLIANTVRWSENLPRIHGLPDGSFDGSFASYEREIHPDDRERVLASASRAISEGVPHDVEYRIVAPDGTIRWVEGKGRVEYDQGRPVRMTGVCMVVTRRKEAELARLAAAEEASRLKDEFLATLSHELRTPLNAILGWVQLLRLEGLTLERARHAVEVIGRNATLQGQLIEDILDVSRIITGKLELEREPLLLPQVVESVVASITPAAQAKRVALSCALSGQLPPVEGDRRRLAQVLGNVVGNALKFTPEGGRVHITCETEPDGIRLEVRDSGAGIAPEFLPFVFERFRQGDSSSTRVHGGLGLGLAIARHIVEQHGGTIAAHSDGPGHGTTIQISLPAPPAASLSASASRDGGALRCARFDGLSVLVVDDQADSRELMTALLGAQGATVAQCHSAAAALEFVSRSVPDLLVADIAMPGMDGYRLLSTVRERHPALPAIAVTAYARPEDRQRATAAGFDRHCAKPVDASAFLACVDQVTRQARPAGGVTG